MDVVYDDRDARFRSETKGLQVNLLPTGSGIAGDLAGDLTPGSTTTIRWEPRGTTLSLRGGRARFSPGGAGVDKLQLDAPEGRISSDVRFAFKGTDRFALTARADLKADQLAGWVQALETARGDLAGRHLDAGGRRRAGLCRHRGHEPADGLARARVERPARRRAARDRRRHAQHDGDAARPRHARGQRPVWRGPATATTTPS